VNGIVGISPTVGLVSRAGVIPIAKSFDTVGPMSRTVKDAAILLNVIAGSDPLDPATASSGAHKVDYTQCLKKDALKGKRIGVVRALVNKNPEVVRILDQAVGTLKSLGAKAVPVTIPHLNTYYSEYRTVLLYEFKAEINKYLEGRKGIPVSSLDDLIKWNRKHKESELRWFGQDQFLAARKAGPLTDKKYTEALAKLKRLTGPEGIDTALKTKSLDALVTITQGPAWKSDLVNDDPAFQGRAGPAALAGYPAITVPAGFIHGLPVGLLFFGAKWMEPRLISYAYAFEQAAKVRRPPHFRSTVIWARTDSKPIRARPVGSR
jgi:amidase